MKVSGARQRRDLRWCWVLFLLCVVSLMPACRRKVATESSWQDQLDRDELSERQFTDIVAMALRERLPQHAVQVEGPLEILVVADAGRTTCRLDNVWLEVGQDKDARSRLVRQHLDVVESTLSMMLRDDPIDRSQIVPLIKDERWLLEARKSGLSVHREPLSSDLFVVFAIDGEQQLAFLSVDDVKQLQLSGEPLLERAVKNLEARLTTVKRHGEGPLYMLTAGGTFEASLLLIDDLWTTQDEAVDGSVVVAVPSRDLLLFTGENATEAISQMRRQVADVFAQGNYLISQTLLIRQDGRWQPFLP